MTNNTVNSKTNKEKKLRYVVVYEKLYELIKDGVYPINSQLPSENELAVQMGVSRMTLRQALKFLQDDGVIKNIRGKGHFILSNTSKWKDGLESFTHPIYKSLNIIIDDVEIDFSIEPSTDYTNKILKHQTPVVLFLNRWYKSGDKFVAYTFSTIPIQTISNHNVDLKHVDKLKDFFNKDIYNIAKHALLHIQYSEVGNISSFKYKISDNNKFYLLQEEIYIDDEFPSIHNKHYLPIDLTQLDISINRI